MDTPIISSDPPAKPSNSFTPAKPKKRKMSAAGRKAVSDAAKARWAARKSAPTPVEVTPIPAANPVPAPPSPAVLKLQEQVVELVSQRHQARALLNEAHNAYLAAQSRFQAAEGELKGIEQEVQYRIGLIAQLENRPNIALMSTAATGYSNTPSVLQMPAAGGTVTSEPAQQPPNQQHFAMALADDVKRDFREMM